MTDIPNPRAFSFIGGDSGNWSVASQRTLLGEPIANVSHVEMVAGARPDMPPGAAWMLRGVATNDRYTTASEKAELLRLQMPVGRASSTRSALILMRKSPAWWALAQDERRAILEEQSHHIAIGMRYLPAVSRAASLPGLRHRRAFRFHRVSGLCRGRRTRFRRDGRPIARHPGMDLHGARNRYTPGEIVNRRYLSISAVCSIARQ